MSESVKLPPIGRVPNTSETVRQADLEKDQDHTLIGMPGESVAPVDEKKSAEGKQAPIGEIVPTIDEPNQLNRTETKSNVPEELRKSIRMPGKERMNSQLIKKSSFVDDFNFGQIKRSLTMTYAEGKADKAAAMKKAGGESKEKDQKIAKDAKALLWGLVGHEWALLLLGLPFMFAGSMIDFLAPNYIGRMMDAFADNNFDDNNDGVYPLIKQWLVIIVISGASTFLREIIFGITSQRLGKNLRQKLFNALLRKDVTFYDNIRTGDLLSRLTSDTEIVQDGLTTNVSMFFKAAATIIAVVIILFTYHAGLACIIVLCILPQIVASRVTTRYLFAFAVRYQKAMGEMSSIGAESLSNIRTVKAFADEEMTTLKFALANQHVFEYGRAKGYFWSLFFLSYTFVTASGDLLIIFVISRTFERFNLTIGQITGIMLYVRTIMSNNREITLNVQAIAKVFGSSYEIALLIVAPNSVICEGKARPDEDKDATADGSMVLENIKFAYPSKADVPVLKGISIDVRKNQVVALVGHSGCGKSSVIQLIERFYDPEDGKVLFSGEEIKDLDNKWYHQTQIALVQQEPILFSCSIRDNILYGVDFGNATKKEIDERLREACTMANAVSFIEDKTLFPKGYDSLVGERGVRLSGGQKQRIAIARALVRKPKIILLDEATSALDAESEHQVQQALDQLIAAQEQTCIVIAHRLSTIRNANKIVVLRKGEIMEQGTHDELIANDGAYKKLVQRQLMKSELEESIRKDQE